MRSSILPSLTVRVLTGAVGCVSALSLWSAAARAQAAATKVACVGEQTTHSDQLNRAVEYPATLQKELGAAYDVENFGDCCATVLMGYPKQPETHPYLSGGSNPSFTQSLPFAPNVVIIGSWGKHDTEIADSLYDGGLDPAQFQSNYETLLTTYLSLPTKPLVYLSTPVPIPSGQPIGPTTTVILPTVEAMAAKYHLPIVPLYEKFLNQPQLDKDSTHVTDDAGLQAIADAVYAAMTAGAEGGVGDYVEAGGAPGDDAGEFEAADSGAAVTPTAPTFDDAGAPVTGTADTATLPETGSSSGCAVSNGESPSAPLGAFGFAGAVFLLAGRARRRSRSRR